MLSRREQIQKLNDKIQELNLIGYEADIEETSKGDRWVLRKIYGQAVEASTPTYLGLSRKITEFHRVEQFKALMLNDEIRKEGEIRDEDVIDAIASHTSACGAFLEFATNRLNVTTGAIAGKLLEMELAGLIKQMSMGEWVIMEKKERSERQKDQLNEPGKVSDSFLILSETVRETREQAFIGGFDAVTDYAIPYTVVTRLAESELSIDGKVQTLADLLCGGAEYSYDPCGDYQEQFLMLADKNRVNVKVYGINLNYPMLSPELFKDRMVLVTTLQIRVQFDPRSHPKKATGYQDCYIKNQDKGWWLWGAGRFGVEVKGHGFSATRNFGTYYDSSVPQVCLIELPESEQTDSQRFELHVLIP